MRQWISPGFHRVNYLPPKVSLLGAADWEWLKSAKSDIETIDAIHAQELGRKGLSDSDQLLFTISVRNEKPFGVFVDNSVSCT